MAKVKPKTAAEPTKKPAEAADEVRTKKEPEEGSFFVYIGPNIPGVIQTASIYGGSREEVLKILAYATEKHPRIKALLASGEELARCQKEIETPGTRLHIEYKRLVAEMRK